MPQDDLDNAVKAPTSADEEQAKDMSYAYEHCTLCGVCGLVFFPNVPGGEHYRYPNWAEQESSRRQVAATNAWLEQHRPLCSVLALASTLLDHLAALRARMIGRSF